MPAVTHESSEHLELNQVLSTRFFPLHDLQRYKQSGETSSRLPVKHEGPLSCCSWPCVAWWTLRSSLWVSLLRAVSRGVLVRQPAS